MEEKEWREKELEGLSTQTQKTRQTDGRKGKEMGEQKLIKETNENRYIEGYEGNKKSQNQKAFMLVTIHRSMEPNKLF